MSRRAPEWWLRQHREGRSIRARYSAPKTARNLLVVELQDEDGWTFPEIARQMRVSTQRAHQIYHGTKRRMHEHE